MLGRTAHDAVVLLVSAGATAGTVLPFVKARVRPSGANRWGRRAHAVAAAKRAANEGRRRETKPVPQVRAVEHARPAAGTHVPHLDVSRLWQAQAVSIRREHAAWTPGTASTRCRFPVAGSHRAGSGPSRSRPQASVFPSGEKAHQCTGALLLAAPGKTCRSRPVRASQSRADTRSATCQPAPVGRKRDGARPILAAGQRAAQFARAGIPQFHGLIQARARQRFVVRRKSDIVGVGVVPPARPQEAAGRHIPTANRGVLIAACNKRPIRRNGDRVHPTHAAPNRPHHRFCVQVPDGDITVPAPAHDKASVRGKGKGADWRRGPVWAITAQGPQRRSRPQEERSQEKKQNQEHGRSNKNHANAARAGRRPTITATRSGGRRGGSGRNSNHHWSPFSPYQPSRDRDTHARVTRPAAPPRT
jgi:hypothetical protein